MTWLDVLILGFAAITPIAGRVLGHNPSSDRASTAPAWLRVSLYGWVFMASGVALFCLLEPGQIYWLSGQSVHRGSLGMLAAALAVGALWFPLNMRASSSSTASPDVTETPADPPGPQEPVVVALNQLDALRSEPDPQARVEGVARVAREFVWQHFGVGGGASSSSEMVEQLKALIGPECLDPLRRALRLADHARFGQPVTSHQLPDTLDLDLRTFIHASLSDAPRA